MRRPSHEEFERIVNAELNANASQISVAVNLIRHRDGLEIRDVAKALGVSLSTVTNWRRAITSPRSEEIWRLQALSCGALRAAVGIRQSGRVVRLYVLDGDTARFEISQPEMAKILDDQRLRYARYIYSLTNHIQKRDDVTLLSIANVIPVTFSRLCNWRNGTAAPQHWELGVLLALARGRFCVHLTHDGIPVLAVPPQPVSAAPIMATADTPPVE